jgi:Peptidase M15
MILTLEKYLTSNGRHPEALKEWSGEFEKNALKTIALVSEFASLANFKIKDITSGWRYPNLNKKVGGASQSKHLFAQAIDVSDPEKKFGIWLVSNVALLRDRGCSVESLVKTHHSDNPMERWIHFQTQIPPSGNIIFNP